MIKLIKEFRWIVTESNDTMIMTVEDRFYEKIRVKNEEIFTAERVLLSDSDKTENVAGMIADIINNEIKQNDLWSKIYDRVRKIYLFKGIDKDVVFLGLKFTTIPERIDVCYMLSNDDSNKLTSILQEEI